VHLEKTIPIEKGSDTRLNIKLDAQRRSMKAILLLFTEPYSPGARDSEKYVFPHLTKVRVTINGSHMNLKLFLAGDRFGLVIELRSVGDRTMHGSGRR